jgi:hypothetical protein
MLIYQQEEQHVIVMAEDVATIAGPHFFPDLGRIDATRGNEPAGIVA